MSSNHYSQTTLANTISYVAWYQKYFARVDFSVPSLDAVEAPPGDPLLPQMPMCISAGADLCGVSPKEDGLFEVFHYDDKSKIIIQGFIEPTKGTLVNEALVHDLRTATQDGDGWTVIEFDVGIDDSGEVVTVIFKVMNLCSRIFQNVIRQHPTSMDETVIH